MKAAAQHAAGVGLRAAVEAGAAHAKHGIAIGIIAATGRPRKAIHAEGSTRTIADHLTIQATPDFPAAGVVRLAATVIARGARTAVSLSVYVLTGACKRQRHQQLSCEGNPFPIHYPTFSGTSSRQ